jgi:hypothetical protein
LTARDYLSYHLRWMAKILILGGYGYTGKPLARHLAENCEADIVIAGRRLEKAQDYAGHLNSKYKTRRVSAVRADAADKESLRRALPGVTIMVVAAPTTRYADTVARAALECGADYLDVQLGAQKLALLNKLAREITSAGRCFITEAGFHPGLPAAMVRYAASYLDRLDSAVTAGYLSIGRKMPYTEAVDELMDMFKTYQAQVYKNGRWTKPGSYDIRKVNFGGEIGVRRCFSMFFEELRPLPEMYPCLKEVGFYISETHPLLDWVISPLVIAGLKLFPQRGMKPMGKLMWWGMQNLSRPPRVVSLKVEAAGEKNGKPAVVESSVTHPDGYELTAIPVAACLLQYLDGSARRPGLWMMGHLVEPVRLFEDMKRMGVQVASKIT